MELIRGITVVLWDAHGRVRARNSGMKRPFVVRPLEVRLERVHNRATFSTGGYPVKF